MYVYISVCVGVRDVMVTIVVNEHSNMRSNPMQTLAKGINPIILFPVIGK